jgi:glycosyltransferase involved in cell wall biosynthesis
MNLPGERPPANDTSALVSIVVPVRNGEDCIDSCLTSVLAARYPSDRREILVVDNGSVDRTAEIVSRHPITYLFEPEVGPSPARNRGIEASSGEIVAFLDADCVVTKGWLEKLVAPFSAPDVWGVAGEILSYPPETRAQRYMAMRKARWQKPAVESEWWPFAVTANCAFRRETFARIGYFDPVLIRAQDKDFGHRFLSVGLKMAYSPKAIVLHRHRATTRGFYQQHQGWGFGASLLHVKYGLPWGWGHEARKYGELLRSLWGLGVGGLRYTQRRGGEMEFYYAYYEVLRRVAHRVGLLQGIAWRLKRGWNAEWPTAPPHSSPPPGSPSEETA